MITLTCLVDEGLFSRGLIARVEERLGKKRKGRKKREKIVGAPYAMECLCMERCSASCKGQVL